jgi:AraC-like DNA-binding protein
MQLIFDLQDGSSFSLQAGLPPGYRGIILQGAVYASLQTSSELIVLQHFVRTDFAIQLGIYKFLHFVRSILRPPPFSTGSLLVLRKELNCRMEGIDKLSLKKGQFSFIHFAGENLLANFEGGHEYQLLEISCYPELLSQALSHFPGLGEQFLKAGSHSNASLLSAPRAAGEKSLDLVHDLLHSHFVPGINEIYFQYKVREYFFLLLVETSKTEAPGMVLTKDEEDRMRKLGERLQQDPQGRFPIATLAKEMGMNEMKLKLAFKQVNGKGIFEYHLDQRMKVALRLLKYSELSTKEIAALVGYEFTTNFISRFRKYYGFPPSKIQRKR